MMPMGAGSDSAFRQIVSAIASSTGQGIVDAPTRIYCGVAGAVSWGALIYTALASASKPRRSAASAY